MSIPYIPVRQTPVNGSGRPYPSATRTFYRAGTTTLASVYADNSRSVPLSNPQIANTAGRFDAAYLDPSYTYRVVLKDSSGNTLADDDYVPSTAPFSSSEVGVALYPKTSAETSAGVTPTNYQYPFGNVLRYGADLTGGNDSTSAINNAIAAVFAATYGGTVFFPAGEYKVTSTIVLPKSITKSIRIIGEGPRASVLYAGSNITAGDPMVRWSTAASGSVQLQEISNLQLARLNGGPLIQFRQVTAGGLGDRPSIALRDLVLRQSTTAGQGANLDFEYSIKSYIERVWLEGGNPSGVGISWRNCSQDYFCEIYGNGKTTVGDFFLIDGGGDHTLVATRSEGCAGNYFYKLKDCDHVTLLSPWMESDAASDSILLDGARYCAIYNVSLGDQTGATNPNGIRFASTTRGCVGNVIIGGKSASYDAMGTGYTVAFDASSSGNIVQNIVIEGVSSVSGEVSVAGTDNFVTLIPGAGTPPTVQTFASGEFRGSGVLSRGTSAKFGTSDNYEVVMVKNGNTTATFTGTGLKLASQAAAAGAAGELVIGTATQSTVGSAGGASSLPATPSGYLRFFLGSTEYVLPYYAKA